MEVYRSISQFLITLLHIGLTGTVIGGLLLSIYHQWVGPITEYRTIINHSGLVIAILTTIGLVPMATEWFISYYGGTQYTFNIFGRWIYSSKASVILLMLAIPAIAGLLFYSPQIRTQKMPFMIICTLMILPTIHNQFFNQIPPHDFEGFDMIE